MIKLFVSDIDGTLLNEHHELASETENAINELRKTGVSFMLASGRHYEAILKPIQHMHLNIKCIALNGADYRDNEGNSILNYPLEDEKVAQIQKIIEEADATLEYYCKDYAFTQVPLDKIEEVYILNFMDMCQITYEQSCKFVKELDVKRLMTYESDFKKIKEHGLLKIEFHFRSASERNKTLVALEAMKGLQVTSSAPLNIEVTHQKATKGDMLKAVCEYYGYQKDEVALIGDSENDISMLSMFPNSYAMGNAQQAVKEVASYIAASNCENGVAQTIYKIIKENAQGC